MTSDTAVIRRRIGRAGVVVMLPALLALATVTSTATKLRFPGLPVGIGELLLAGWLASSVTLRSVATGFHWHQGLALRWGGLFVLTTSCALLCGAFLAKALGVTSMYGTTHEAVAWIFVMSLLGWFLLESGTPVTVERFLVFFAGIGTMAASSLFIAAILSWLLLGSQALWNSGFRMSGWSENPNQLAAMLAPLPFLAWQFRRDARVPGIRRRWTAGIVGTVLAGLATQSDALFVAWLLGTSILVGSYWIRGIIGRERTVRSVLVNGIVMPLVLAVMLVPTGGMLARLVESAVEDRASEGGQAGIRVTLWNHGLDAAFESPIVGWGPGSHSGFAHAFQGIESHNTYIDLAAQAGFLSSFALLAIFGIAMFLALHRRAAPLAVAVLAIAVLALFHNVLRQPVFWFTVFGVMAASCTGTRALASGRGAGGVVSSTV